MESPHTLVNLAAYALQLACIAALAELLLRLLPVAAAGFRYAYWRLVLIGALVLPWLLRVPPGDALPAASLDTSVAPVTLTPVADVASAAAAGAAPWVPALVWLGGLGALLRLLWVGAGLVRLRSLRRGGVVVDDPIAAEMQQRLGTRAEIRSVAGLGQPVTFGLWRPVVLVPAALDRTDEGIRRAAIAHELIHVLRRDWLSVLIEEAVRVVFWFHPAIWWMTARIRLTREEFTDHLAVLATGSRRTYIEALMAFADRGGIEPAPAFIGRGHLFHRIVLLSKESVMTSRRVVVSGSALALLFGLGSWYVTEAFPMVTARSSSTLPAPATQQASGPSQAAIPATPENPIPRRLAATPIGYPLELAGSRFESAISVRVVVNANGFVESARAGARSVGIPGSVAAPGENSLSARTSALVEQEAMERFAAAAVEAISQWHYEPPARAPIAFYVGVVFRPGVPAAVAESRTPFAVLAGPDGARLAVGGFTDALPFVGQSPAVGRGASAAPQGGGRQGGAPQGGAVGGPLDPLRVAPPPPPPPPPPPGAGAPVRIGGGIRAPTQTRKVNPVYPAIAQSARVQGVVILEALIDEQGRVANARVLRSIPLLDQAALDAVRQWEYVPTLLNGAPTPVIMTVTVQFTLTEPAPQN